MYKKFDLASQNAEVLRCESVSDISLEHDYDLLAHKCVHSRSLCKFMRFRSESLTLSHTAT